MVKGMDIHSGRLLDGSGFPETDPFGHGTAFILISVPDSVRNYSGPRLSLETVAPLSIATAVNAATSLSSGKFS